MQIRRMWSGVAVLAVLLGLAAVPGARSQSLRSRLRSTKSRKAAVREKLKNIKAEQATRRNVLSAAQRQARTAKSAYDATKNQLQNTRAELRGARADLEACTARLETHDKAVSARIKVIYEMGEPSYMEVLLDATTFSDFIERADYMQRLAQQDANLLVKFTNEKKQADALRRQLEEAETRERKQAAELNRLKVERESRATEAERLLKQANSDRAAAERQLAELERASKEIEQMLADLQRGRGSHSHLRYGGTWSGWGSAPIQSGYRISSRYGWRTHPISRRRNFHDGVDLACSSGTPIHAAATGRVVHSGWYSAYGIAVIVDHGSGWSTLYGHCSRTAVAAGQTVSAGQVVGHVGTTGYSTGPHLHYSVRRYGKPQSPGGAY